ncbi:hypothetical protein R1flu_015437 [Riccia fluitans]|uniref:Uncharacterized protein n=1 Tax=Riccia fluitans TaxID=41844 RepID=A0ABD1YIY0_9MARC
MEEEADEEELKQESGNLSCEEVLADFRRIYDLIDCLVYSLQLVRRHKPEAEEFVDFLEDQYIVMHEKAAVLYPDAQNQLSRALHKHMHHLEELLRSAQELLNELAEPFRIFTRASERLKTLREDIEKTLGLMDIVLQFAPHKLDVYGETLINVGQYDPLPEKWYEPPPAAEILLESRSSSSSLRGDEPGEATLTRSQTPTVRLLDEVRKNSNLYSDFLGYADNRRQLHHMIESLTKFAPAEDTGHQVSPYLQLALR